jgi:transposase
MTHCIMIGCDLHDGSLVLQIAQDRQTPEMRIWKNTQRERLHMIDDLQRRAAVAGGARIVFAYEASGAGFGLYDQLREAGIEGYVLAPSKIPRSSRHKREKTDPKDALRILELVRAYVLAGNPLPTVWIPDHQTRDDREMVRIRLDMGDKITLVKAQIKHLLKRNSLTRPLDVGKGWTKLFLFWLQDLAQEAPLTLAKPLPYGTRSALSSLLRQLNFLEQEQKRLEKQLGILADGPRYLPAVQELVSLTGVGVLTAMVFLTEMGDLTRFSNRRQIAAYLGLAPSSYESGEARDRKGHITHQGSWRVRKVLCQACWARIRHDPEEKAVYDRIRAKNPKRTKIAIVANMRRLSIRMWHRGLCAPSPPKTRKATATVCGKFTDGFSQVSNGCPKGKKGGCGLVKKEKCPGKSGRSSRGR